MNRYEKEYRQLLANGAIAWAGEGYSRAKEQQERVFSWLHLQHYFLSELSAIFISVRMRRLSSLLMAAVCIA